MSSCDTGCKGHQRFFGGGWMIRHGSPALKIHAYLIALGLLSCTNATFAQCVQEDVKLVGSATAHDYFGMSVAISEDVAVVRGLGNGCPGFDFGSLYVYRRSGTTWVEETKLCAAGGWGIDIFGGSSVAVNGDTAVLGAYFDDCADGGSCGSVYVYRFDGGAWVEEQKLAASDAGHTDLFGFSVFISGDAIVVGTLNNNAAYIFRCIPGAPGHWVEEGRLIASDAGTYDNFGASVSTNGDVAIVGAPHASCTGGSDCGSAYLFRFNGSTWVEDAKLAASDAGNGDIFGVSVSISGDVAIVGAHLNDCAAGFDCGSAYIYRFNPGAPGYWVEEAQLTPSDAAAYDAFGHSVSVSGDVAVVGAYGDDCASGSCGSAYVYWFNGNAWVERGKLNASDAAAYANFGGSVSISGDAVVAGAYSSECLAGGFCGSAYVYDLGNLPPPPDCNSNGVDDGCEVAYGTRPDCNDNFIPDECDVAACVGDPRCSDCNANLIPDGCEDDCNANLITDECDIRDCPGGPACSDCNSNAVPDACDMRHGVSRDVDANGIPDECEFGACCNESTGTCTESVPSTDCTDDERSWHVNRFCADIDPPCNARNGACCDFGAGKCRDGLPLGLCSDDQQRWVRGASCAEVGCAGDRADVCAVQTLPNPEGVSQQYFGRAVAIDGDVAIAGSSYPDCAAGSYCGAAYVYRFNSNGPEWWVQEETLTASDAAANAYFGGDVSISGDVAVVGAYGADCYFCGAAYVFRYNGANWIEEQKLLPPVSTERDGFGGTVSIDGDVAVVGHSGEDCELGPDCGAAYVYRFNGVTWSQEAKLVASNVRREDYFARSVSVSGDVIVVGGGRGECYADYECGAAHVFRYQPGAPGAWLEEYKLLTLRGWEVVSVSVNDDVVLLSAFTGCPPNTSGIANCSAAFVYRYHPGPASTWVQEQTFVSDEPYGFGLFGSGVSVSGNWAIIAAQYDGCATGDFCGATYVFRFNGLKWVQQRKLSGGDASFGASVSVSGDRVIVGETDTSCAAGYSCGSAYVFALGPDCNSNGDADFCDVRDGHSSDTNSNIIPDECEGGACCDGVTGVCEDDVPGTQCRGGERSWNRATPCVDLDPLCTGHSGACCDHDPFGGCVDGVMSTTCGCPTCEWFALAECSSVDCPHAPIPTVREWGLIVLTLLLLTGAKIRFGRLWQSRASI